MTKQGRLAGARCAGVDEMSADRGSGVRVLGIVGTGYKLLMTSGGSTGGSGATRYKQNSSALLAVGAGAVLLFLGFFVVPWVDRPGIAIKFVALRRAAIDSHATGCGVVGRRGRADRDARWAPARTPRRSRDGARSPRSAPASRRPARRQAPRRGGRSLADPRRPRGDAGGGV